MTYPQFIQEFIRKASDDPSLVEDVLKAAGPVMPMGLFNYFHATYKSQYFGIPSQDEYDSGDSEIFSFFLLDGFLPFLSGNDIFSGASLDEPLSSFLPKKAQDSLDVALSSLYDNVSASSSRLKPLWLRVFRLSSFWGKSLLFRAGVKSAGIYFSERVATALTSKSARIVVGPGVYLPDEDKVFSNIEMLCAFFGLVLHEGAHLLYTDFDSFAKSKSFGYSGSGQQFYNLLEDVRIESMLLQRYPDFGVFLQAILSRWEFGGDDVNYDEAISSPSGSVLCPADGVLAPQAMSSLIRLFRRPHYSSEKLFDKSVRFKFCEFFWKVKELATPFPFEIDGLENLVSELTALWENSFSLKPYSDAEFDPMRIPFPNIYGEDGNPATKENLSEKRPADSGLASSSDAFEGLANAASEASEDPSTANTSGGPNPDGSSDSFSEGHEFISVPPSKVSPYATHEYEETAKRLAPDSSKLRSLLNVFQGNSVRRTLSTKSGRLSLPQAYKAITHKDSKQFSSILERRHRSRHCVPNIILLIDQSGSMYGERLSAAREVASLFMESLPLSRLAVYSHCHDTYGDLGAAASAPNKITVIHEPGTEPCKARIFHIKSTGANQDSTAIREVVERSSGLFSANSQRLLIVISDGDPSAYYDNSSEVGIEETRKAVLAAQAKGVKCLQIAIDQEVNSHKMFDYWVKFTDSSTLVKDVSNLLAKIIIGA